MLGKKVYVTAASALLLQSLAAPLVGAVSVDNCTEMYAKDFTAGNPVNVLTTNEVRLNPANALGEFDTTQIGNENAFYAVASHDYTTYTFAQDFYNVDGHYDIQLAEVTWGTWHPEAVKVYLTGAVIKDANGNKVQYDGDYYVGIAWNKVGSDLIKNLPPDSIADQLNTKLGSDYFTAEDFANKINTSVDSNITTADINLPDEIVYAKGVKLIDITTETYRLGTERQAATYDQSTDGFDLDAIKVYAPNAPELSGDSATGLGTNIMKKGTWFMYNPYNGTENTFKIVAGNPKNGETVIGTYTVTDNGNGTYTVHYDMYDTVTIDGYEYEIEVTNEHLAISDGLFKSASPGKEANQQFDKAFEDADGQFNIFAHFEVEYYQH
ncbi:hypothetical protein IEO70_09180 [Bacillus sp. AGMB 02131]|uniref:Uncharacterized protein n=1 Tax=Peribacillus faecalis TaxID=2772559 RepID=A0A927CZB7_9BACI|nr:hypothetical protein [Peribacillus faecalis]MBD3108540.1 hypothetical protein [Peribacillus faecalis]